MSSMHQLAMAAIQHGVDGGLTQNDGRCASSYGLNDSSYAGLPSGSMPMMMRSHSGSHNYGGVSCDATYQSSMAMTHAVTSGGQPINSSGMQNMAMNPQYPGQGRHLQILDHTVHRIDTHNKENGEVEKEMVVSNLRHFTLKVGVIDPRPLQSVGQDAELPLKAELLYENGLLVEQLATCEPLLVGKTEVVALQGIALFKLRITSLSSHRDKQRFRIRVSPVEVGLLTREPGLSVVTTPMKCVTKLAHRTNPKGPKGGDMGPGAPRVMEDDEDDDEATGGQKRKRPSLAGDETKEPLELQEQSEQIAKLQHTNQVILEQLRSIKTQLTGFAQVML